MLNVTPGEVPKNDAGYLEMMTKVIFMGGLNRQVVEGKWDGFLAAFEQFDPAKVANFTEEDIERLTEDERIVRYAAKIRAIVKNAERMVEIADQHGSFGDWLRTSVQEKGLSETVKSLAKEFSYLSEESASRYLYAVGEEVGEVPEEIRRKYGPQAA
jgi:3-methyladenine DNA glycosylase Tag